MAKQQTINAIVQLFKKLGGNVSDVLGTRSNVNFLGKGKSPELMVDMDINTEALSILPQSKAVEELESAMGYLAAGKLNDIQANKLLSNMQKMDAIYNPAPAPTNITDLATGTRNLDKEGLMSLRSNLSDDQARSVGINVPRNVDDLPPGDPDLPPPGSRGGPDDISAPFASAEETIKNLAKSEGVDPRETILPTGAGLEAIKNVKGSNLIIDDLVNKIYLNAGVAENAQPVVRANAREFLNRVKDLSDEPGNTTLADVMEVDDFKFMTEGGGGGMGDPLLLVQKYFGPKVASAVAKLDGPNDIQLFAERLVSVKDAKGRTITDRRFDPESVDIDDFEFADGGRVPMFAGGAARMGYQALAKYGIKPKDISRLFASLGSDKTLVGKEKTEYFRMLHKVLRNPDDFPDEILDIQKQLGINVPGLKGGGLAGILEV